MIPLGGITVVGSLNLDSVASVEKMPAVGETVLARSFRQVPGGKGANQAFALGRLGAPVKMLGAVGADAAGELLRRSLAGAGVDVSRLLTAEDEVTGMAMITVDAAGGNRIVVVQGANRRVTKEYIDRNLEAIGESDIVVLQLEIPVGTVLYAAQAAKRLGKTVILDPAPASAGLPPALFRAVDLIKPNETELATLTGAADAARHPERAAAALHAAGVRDVVVTLGGEGVFLSPGDGSALRIPARPVKAVDTTAAGDAFTAALAASLARGEPLPQAAAFANLVSSIVVTRPGAQSSIPTLAEVEAARGR